MRDGSDAIADWPILNALLNASAGATWVSVHHGGGVGIGYSIHAGMVIVADGTREADERLARVLTCDPGIGVARHADAGYPEAIHTAAERRCAYSDGGGKTMMAPHAGLERRVLAALEATPPRIPGACSAAAAPAGRRRCTRWSIGSAATTASTSTSSARPARRSASSRAVTSASPFRAGRRRRDAAHRRARRSITRSRISRARARGDRPATFLLDEVLELRTFESFPGLRHVLRELLQALAESGNRFVLTSRYVARAHRLLRDAHRALRGDPPAGAVAGRSVGACCRRWATPPPTIASS